MDLNYERVVEKILFSEEEIKSKSKKQQERLKNITDNQKKSFYSLEF